MDIGALSISANQTGLSQAVGIKLLSMAKSQMETSGANLVQMMQQSVQPHIGGNLDIRV